MVTELINYNLRAAATEIILMCMGTGSQGRVHYCVWILLLAGTD